MERRLLIQSQMQPELPPDEDHHAMMNGSRIAQSLPNEFFAKLLQLADDKALQEHWKLVKISQQQPPYEFPEEKPIDI